VSFPSRKAEAAGEALANRGGGRAQTGTLPRTRGTGVAAASTALTIGDSFVSRAKRPADDLARSLGAQPKPSVRNRNLNAEIAAREIGELSLPDALSFCLPLPEVDAPRFDRVIERWHARFVLEAQGIRADEAVLALSAAKGLAGLKTRDAAARTLRRLANTTGLAAVAQVLQR
jgi:hypothetical protein